LPRYSPERMREINAACAAMVWIPTRAILHRHGFGWQVKVLD
jgi:hypothetical protein